MNDLEIVVTTQEYIKTHHTNEDDINTIILKIMVTDGIIYKEGKRFEC